MGILEDKDMIWKTFRNMRVSERERDDDDGGGRNVKGGDSLSSFS